MLSGTYVESAETIGPVGLGADVGGDEGAGVAVGLGPATEDCDGEAVK